MSNLRGFLSSLYCAVLFCLGAIPIHAQAAPSISAPAVSPAALTVGEAAAVSATTRITSDAANPVIATGVNLLRVDATGKVLATLGTMRDDGSAGDAIAGDGMFTLQFVANEPTANEVRLRVSAAFKGLLRRILSDQTILAVQVAGGLPGASSAPAIDAFSDLSPRRTDASDIENGVIMTQLVIWIAPDATVGQVNDAIRRAGASIVGMSEGVPLLTIAVPRQPDLDALLAIRRAVESLPGIRRAFLSNVGHPFQLPVQLSEFVDFHLVPTRFPAAWNVRSLVVDSKGNCLKPLVPVVVADEFKAPPPDIKTLNSLVSFDLEIPNFPDPAPGTPSGLDHGNLVTVVLGALFNDAPRTGANPFSQCLAVTGLDLTGLAMPDAMDLISKNLPGGKSILNYSAGYFNCSLAPCLPQFFERNTPIERAVLASVWQMVTADRSADFLVAAGAGNARQYAEFDYYPGLGQAAAASPFTLATLPLDEFGAFLQDSVLWQAQQPGFRDLAVTTEELQWLREQFGPYRPAKNVLKVGSTKYGSTLADLIESDFSNTGADVAAVGEEIETLNRDNQEHLVAGTSFAAPQVAGLASYLWLLSDDLRSRPAEDTVTLIRNTAQGPAWGIDAYSAVLALDQFDPAALRIRKALLDVNDDGDGDGVFDHLDLLEFEKAYRLKDPNSPTIPTERDHSRFDLNGDGYTGGIVTYPFDLDIDAPALEKPNVNAVDAEIEGYAITLNEAALSDIQILCYYAYSPLYANGTPTDEAIQARSTILGPDHCVGARMNVALPATIQNSGTLDVTVETPDGNGGFVPAPNLLLSLTPTCGTLGSANGQTDAAGRFSTTVTPASSCTNVSVEVTARATADAQPLVKGTATAAVVASGSTIHGVAIHTGRIPGMIEVFVIPVFTTTDSEPTFSAPISEASNVIAQLDEALSGVSEIGQFGILFQEPVDLTLSVSANLGALSVNATQTACGSKVSLTAGNILNKGFWPYQGNGVIGGCFSSGTLALGYIANSLEVVSLSGADIRVTAGTVLNVSIGTNHSAVRSSTVQVSANSIGQLGITNTFDSTITVQANVETRLVVTASSNLTLHPLTGGNLDAFTIGSSSFTTSPMITVGNLVHPGGDIVSPNGSLLIQNNRGLMLNTLSVGNIEGNLTITNNRGFSNTDAADFGRARTVGGNTSISGNSP